jgi:hypothetical protein
VKTLLNLPPMLGNDPAELRRRAALVASLRGTARPGVSAPMTGPEVAALRGTPADWHRLAFDGDRRASPYAQLVGRRA